MKGTPWPVKSPHHEFRPVRGRVVGAGASAPTVPSDGLNNGIASATRSGVGVYTVTFKLDLAMPVLLMPHADVIGPNLVAQITSYTAPTATVGAILGISTFNQAGTATEATTSDTIYVGLDGRDSKA